MAKILKNTTSLDIILTVNGFTVPAMSDVTVVVQNYELLASDNSISELTPLINSGDIIINNGSEDLPAQVGINHISSVQGVIYEHGDITLLPAVTVNAPEVMKISDAVIGNCLEVGEEIFGQTRVDLWAGGDVSFQLHCCINNTDLDKWVQFDVSYFTTNGINDKQANAIPSVLTTDAFEVPSTAYRVFEISVDIPSSAFANGEKYLFVGVKRITATGKDAPTNHPVILRYCKQYYKKLEF